MSRLNIISALLNEALLAKSNTFSNKSLDTTTLTIAAITNVIDLLGNLGMFFSSLDLKKSLDYYNQALDLISKENYNSIILNLSCWRIKVG